MLTAKVGAVHALGDVPGANMNLALLAASGIQAVSLWLLAQQGSQWGTLQALVFGWAVARGSKTTQACAAHPAVPSSHGSGQILVSCLSTANFREAQASSSEGKGEKKGAWGQITSLYRVQEENDRVCAFYRTLGRPWGCREVSLSHIV